MKLCGWEVKAGWLIQVAVAGKLCDLSLTRAIPERLGDEQLITKHYANGAYCLLFKVIRDTPHLKHVATLPCDICGTVLMHSGDLLSFLCHPVGSVCAFVCMC